MESAFYLASRSPRRRQLLEQLGARFEIVPADIEERPEPNQTAEHYARQTAVAKAQAVAACMSNDLPVLGADTDVVLDGEILGKPASEADGIAMLLRLSGRAHEVYSAVAMVSGSRVDCRLSVTEVEFGTISTAMAQAYWNTGEPDDKAGGYAIQGIGGRFIRAINGSYSGVVGLPLFETAELLSDFGIRVRP